MTNKTKALENIVNGAKNFCCLCFNICDVSDLVCVNDEVSFKHTSGAENIAMSDLILAVLGSNLSQYVETLENICEQCAKSLFNSYTFIQTCNSNASLLTNALDGLNTAIENIVQPEEQQSLFVSLNLENLSSQFLYDNRLIFNRETALKRFIVLKTSEKKEEQKAKEKINKKYRIKDSAMLLNSSKHIFQCKMCLKMYPSMLKLRKHYTRVHIGISQNCFKHRRRLACKECGETYSSLKLLKSHQMEHKTTIVCQDCGRTYKNKSTFKNHVQLNICKQERRHSPSQAKYTCDYCNKKYTQKVSLRVHIQFEHGNYKSHICEWCGKKFWAQSRLKAHIVKHTRERNFSCPTCQSKFVTKESLLYHTRLHTGEKPYKCPECSSRFLSASRRSNHVKRYHDNAEPGLKCEVCHGKFRSESVLIKHKKTHEEKNKKSEIHSTVHFIADRSKSNTQIDFNEATSNKDVSDITEDFMVQNLVFI